MTAWSTHAPVNRNECHGLERPPSEGQRPLLSIMYVIMSIIFILGMGGGVSIDRLCGLVVRVLSYRSGGPGSIPCTTSSGSGTGSTQPREYN
jgi:hypothetical protein